LFSFLLTDQDNDKIVFEMYEEMKDMSNPMVSKKITQAKVPLEGLRENMNGVADLGEFGQLHFLYEERQAQSVLTQFSHPQIQQDSFESRIEETSQKFDFPAVHIEILEGVNLPIMDSCGTTDPYIQIKLRKYKEKMLHQTKEKVCSRLIMRELNPIWNQVFTKQVHNLETEMVEIKLFDKDEVTKDDLILSKNIELKNLQLGCVYDEWIDAKIHYKIQITPPQFPRLISRNLSHLAYQLHVKFLEGYDFRDPGEYYCVLRINSQSDITGKSTIKTRRTNCPQWFSELTYLITPTMNDILIELKTDNVGTDIVREKYNYNVEDFIGENFKKTKLIEEKAIGGTIRLLIQVTNVGEVPFTDYVEVDPKVTSENLMCHVKIIEATNLPKGDASASDPYCVMEVSSSGQTILETNKWQTRVLTNTLNPKWNQCFHFDIQSIGTQVITFKVYDQDKITKDDLLATCQLKLVDYADNSSKPLGLVHEEVLDLGRKSSLHILIHICQPGQISYVPQAFTLPKLFVHLNQDFAVPQKMNCYARLRLYGDTEYQYTKIEPPFDHNFMFYMNQFSKDELEIELCTHDHTLTDSLLNSKSTISNLKGYRRIPLSSFLHLEERKIFGLNISQNETVQNESTPNESTQNEKDLEKELKGVEMLATLRPTSEINALNFTIPMAKSENAFMLYISAQEGVFQKGRTNYVYLKYSFERKIFGNGKNEEINSERTVVDYSRITNTNRFDSISQLKIDSLNSDILTIELYEYKFDEYPKSKFHPHQEKENLLGRTQINLREIGFGNVYDSNIKLGSNSEIHFILNVAQPNSIPFMINLFTPYILKILIAEATDVPKMDLMSKSDPYVETWLESDVSKSRTKTIDDTLTPQWMEEKEFILTDLHEGLHFRLMDENVTKDQEISKYVYDLSNLQIGVPKEEWIEMNSSGKKNGGKLNVFFLIMTWGVSDLDINSLLYSIVN